MLVTLQQFWGERQFFFKAVTIFLAIEQFSCEEGHGFVCTPWQRQPTVTAQMSCQTGSV
jgi:hypothetical protein